MEVRLRHHPISASPVPPQTTNPSVLIPSRRLPSLLVPQAVSPISTAHLLHIPSATLVSRLHSVPPGWPPFLVPLPGLGVSQSQPATTRIGYQWNSSLSGLVPVDPAKQPGHGEASPPGPGRWGARPTRGPLVGEAPVSLLPPILGSWGPPGPSELPRSPGLPSDSSPPAPPPAPPSSPHMASES